ncbi:MAG: tRNA (N(6)-L-threonylcarbamoyladenosine(37)-C(2))-methylthiotransferase MtaB [Ruminococcaceae bacterium]|nr:tRNA (N(6)-L-threonylcarbamoyladenosine(37)-C(2))-methylthiotransferase MtaB [Oscillospiraceae bacterium]
MNVKFVTLGCKVNQYESEAMLSMLNKRGIMTSENDTADIIVLNSCTVTAESDRKVRQTLRRLRKLNPTAVIVLTGCMVQAFPKTSEELKEADIIIGNVNRSKLFDHIMNFISAKQRIIDIENHENGEKFEKMQVENFSERTRAYIKIEDGCNRFCSYCIIPYARGRVRSKELSELKSETQILGKNGYKEIVLTGINLSCYGSDIGLTLADAIECVCADENIERVRLGSLEPEQLTPDVISRLSKQKKLCPQFHLSLQSGCDETLKRMNRHYNSAEYREIVNNLRNAFENAAITTDIMVGFAGETEEEYEKNLNFAKEIKFSKAHVFAYSRRPGTRADKFPMQLTNKVKEERSRLMIEATEKTQREFTLSQIGKVESVLFEQEREEGVYFGYTMNYTPVLVKSDTDIHGKILKVKLNSIDGENLIGTLI